MSFEVTAGIADVLEPGVVHRLSAKSCGVRPGAGLARPLPPACRSPDLERVPSDTGRARAASAASGRAGDCFTHLVEDTAGLSQLAGCQGHAVMGCGNGTESAHASRNRLPSCCWRQAARCWRRPTCSDHAAASPRAAGIARSAFFSGSLLKRYYADGGLDAAGSPARPMLLALEDGLGFAASWETAATTSPPAARALPRILTRFRVGRKHRQR